MTITNLERHMGYGLKKHYSGCYRFRHPKNSFNFGQIKKVGRVWHADIRSIETGELVRHAGIWRRRRDAVEEVAHILGR